MAARTMEDKGTGKGKTVGKDKGAQHDDEGDDIIASELPQCKRKVSGRRRQRACKRKGNREDMEVQGGGEEDQGSGKGSGKEKDKVGGKSSGKRFKMRHLLITVTEDELEDEESCMQRCSACGWKRPDRGIVECKACGSMN